MKGTSVAAAALASASVLAVVLFVAIAGFSSPSGNTDPSTSANSPGGRRPPLLVGASAALRLMAQGGAMRKELAHAGMEKTEKTEMDMWPADLNGNGRLDVSVRNMRAGC